MLKTKEFWMTKGTQLYVSFYFMQQTLFSLSILFIVLFSDGSINLVPTYKILITIEIYYVYIKNLGLESVYLCLFTTLCEQRTYFSRGGILRK